MWIYTTDENRTIISVDSVLSFGVRKLTVRESERDGDVEDMCVYCERADAKFMLFKGTAFEAEQAFNVIVSWLNHIPQSTSDGATPSRLQRVLRLSDHVARFRHGVVNVVEMEGRIDWPGKNAPATAVAVVAAHDEKMPPSKAVGGFGPAPAIRNMAEKRWIPQHIPGGKSRGTYHHNSAGGVVLMCACGSVFCLSDWGWDISSAGELLPPFIHYDSAGCGFVVHGLRDYKNQVETRKAESDGWIPDAGWIPRGKGLPGQERPSWTYLSSGFRDHLPVVTCRCGALFDLDDRGISLSGQLDTPKGQSCGFVLRGLKDYDGPAISPSSSHSGTVRP
jgi:hypothetical protein